jgi:hypothetical protein
MISLRPVYPKTV